MGQKVWHEAGLLLLLSLCMSQRRVLLCCLTTEVMF